MPPFVYFSPNNSQVQSSTAVIVLPEIFGLENQTKEFTDKICHKYGVHAYALDFFYILNAKNNDFDYFTEVARGTELMQIMTASDFDEIFTRAIDSIKHDNPHITKIITLGFCFGGSLALYSGIHHYVSEVICFYPGQALKPKFDGTFTISELVAQKRETILPINFLFGSEDTSLSEEDRSKIQSTLAINSNLRVESRVYHTGHAFMNNERTTYNAVVADGAWLFLDQIFTNYAS